MPEVCRRGDYLTTGHICTTTTTLDTPGQLKVFAQGELVARITDPTVSHTNPPSPLCPPHVANVNVGSLTVYVGGLKMARIGDSADLGVMITGASNVFAGG